MLSVGQGQAGSVLTMTLYPPWDIVEGAVTNTEVEKVLIPPVIGIKLDRSDGTTLQPVGTIQSYL